MAFNPSEKVKSAREIAKKYNKTMVIITMIDDDTLECISYGKTKLLCDEAKIVSDKIYGAAFEHFDN